MGGGEKERFMGVKERAFVAQRISHSFIVFGRFSNITISRQLKQRSEWRKEEKKHNRLGGEGEEEEEMGWW